LTSEDPYAATKPILDGGGTLGRIITIAADDVTIDGLEVANGKEDLIRQGSADFQPTLSNHQFDHLLDSRLSLDSLYPDLTTRRTRVPWSSRGKRHTPWSTDKTLAVPQQSGHTPLIPPRREKGVAMSKQTVPLSGFTRLIHPMPAFLVTCAGADGRPNAVAIAWLTPVSINPPLLAFAIRPQRYSYDLLQENTAFVVNAMAYDRAVEVLFCGRCSGRDVDKLATAGLTPVDSQAVNVPAIGEALAHVECEVEAEYPAGDHVIVVGRVVAASAEEGVLVDGHRDLVAAPPLFHLGGNRFTTSSGEVSEPDVGMD
jgi:flavin reductase (DIM6/NTAB) family NADH-FMN oxidoreductase RutF